MKRLIFSTIGVIMTFVWIIYTAPSVQQKAGAENKQQIKTINKSGLESLKKIRQPLSKGFEFDKLRKAGNLIRSGSKILTDPSDGKE